jgi:hypothetical protein
MYVSYMATGTLIIREVHLEFSGCSGFAVDRSRRSLLFAISFHKRFFDLSGEKRGEFAHQCKQVGAQNEFPCLNIMRVCTR